MHVLSKELSDIAGGKNRFGARLVALRGELGPYRRTMIAYNSWEGSVVLVTGDNFVLVLCAPSHQDFHAMLAYLLKQLTDTGHSLIRVLATRQKLLGPTLPTLDSIVDLVEEGPLH